jgi:uncharacterized protein (DUF608 family)
MSYEPKNGDVSIFKNDKAEGKQPAYRGTALIDGQKYKISLWVKEGQKGKFFTGRIEPDNYKKPETSELPEPDNVRQIEDTGLPF